MATSTISIPIRDDVPRTLEQVAEALGAPYTINTLRAAADRGDLVTYRVVGTALFTDRRYVEDWIERCRARASEPDPRCARAGDPNMHPLSKGVRLVWRADRGIPGSAGFRAGSWVIRDCRRERRLGLGKRQKGEADLRLAEYIGERHIDEIPADGPQPTHRYLISDALVLYGAEHAPTVADPARIGYAIKALLPFWNDKTVSEIVKKTCRDYIRFRAGEGVAEGTTRSELGKLRAALNFAVSEGRLLSAPPVALLALARALADPQRSRSPRPGRPTVEPNPAPRSIRPDRRLYRHSVGSDQALRWTKSLAGGHVDLDNGVLYRKPAQAAESKKKQPAARLPNRLIRLMEIWRREDGRFCSERKMDPDLLPIVHYYGTPIDKLRSSWRSVCDAAKLDADVVAHSLRHTAITWSAQAGADRWAMCSFFGISMAELERTYLHHHPDYQSSVVNAFDKRRA